MQSGIVLKTLLLSFAVFAISLIQAQEIGTARSTDKAQAMRIYVRGYGGDFTLTDHHGNPFSLEKSRGKVVILYFGYTSCADICPTTLIDVAASMRKLGPSAERVVPLMVTVDPQRDTLERLRTYLTYMHPSLLGLTGSQEEIDAVTRIYRAPAYLRKKDRNGYYVVDHSSHLYVVDPAGRLAYLVPYQTSTDEIVRIVHELLGDGETSAKMASHRR